MLGLDRQKWERIGPSSVPSAAALVVVASVLLALNRFGGLVTDEPRSFLRLVLVGVWGWLGLALIAWAVLGAIGTTRGRPSWTLRVVVAVTGAAHVPLIFLSAMLFVAAGLLQLLWPGLLTSVFVFAFWFPAAIVVGLRVSCGASTRSAVAATSVAYAAWVSVIGRHLHDQLAHLI